MASILSEIFSHKCQEIAARQSVVPHSHLERQANSAGPTRDFRAALTDSGFRQPDEEIDRYSAPRNLPKLIAEIKYASPSKGVLRSDKNPQALAQAYINAGAAAISVLTDQKYFQGELSYLEAVSHAPSQVPLLQKDFIVSPYQIFEARAAGADAVLLIIAGLDQGRYLELFDVVTSLNMQALVEVHNRGELERALACSPEMIGVNNRDLHTFTTDIQTTLGLIGEIPAGVCVVSESGIHTHADVIRLAEAGVDAVLIGEALVTAPDVTEKIQELFTPSVSIRQ